MSLVSRELFKSLVKRYESTIQTNKSMLLVYLNNSVGIGEHPQHIDEMDKMLSEITESNDKLEFLLKDFNNEEYLNK